MQLAFLLNAFALLTSVSIYRELIKYKAKQTGLLLSLRHK